MAKTLVGGMRPASLGPNILKTAARAGVMADRRHEPGPGVGTKYMRNLGGLVVLRQIDTPISAVLEEAPAEEKDPERVLADAAKAGQAAVAHEARLDEELEEVEAGEAVAV